VNGSLEQLKRLFKADSSNQGAFEALVVARSRVEGSGVYLELLNDRLLWNRCSAAIQDCAIDAVQSALGLDFELKIHDASSRAAWYSCAEQGHRIATFRHCLTGVELNLIPGGQFRMGPLGREYLEEGQSRFKHVTIDKPLLVGRFPVSQREWDVVGGDDDRRDWGAEYPIDHVTWSAICDWLEKAGSQFRLPLEAEWEYACRSGTETQRFWNLAGGDEGMDDSYCWHFQNSGERPHEVSEHVLKANAFGLVDMLGNVLEFCAEEWAGPFMSGPNAHLPASLTSDLNHILRGSSRCHHIPGAKSSTRFVSSVRGSAAVGFRLVREL
jgi:formylglycine-generating enzyme required for sulfatase activity